MNGRRCFLMAGGGTGGHVIPALAVARELRRRGHEVFFVGTRHGIEAGLVPGEGFPIEWVEVGGLNRVGLLQAARTLFQLPRGIWLSMRYLRRRRAAAVFSMGGYAAGPVMIAAWLLRVPVVLMEPNAIPGFTNRRWGRFVSRALVTFQEAARYFPAGRTELTGLPVREEFFALPPKTAGGEAAVLVTGGSRGSRTLNRAAREAWPRLREAQVSLRWIHQSGAEEEAELKSALQASGVTGEVRAFIADMPEAFGRADLVVCRSGAGAVAELCAAGKASILVPFPFAADDHQKKNAEAMARAGAARLVSDAELTGERLWSEIRSLIREPGLLEAMGRKARELARPGAARRAADLLEELGRRVLTN